MKLGLYLCNHFPAKDSMAARLDGLVEQTRLAREAGFASLWAPNHFLTKPLQMIQAIPLLARMAPEAEGMTIGPNVLILPMLNPMKVAEEAVSMDLLTGGRFVLGVGLGYREGEFVAAGVPRSERVSRLEEGIEVIRRLWSEETVTHRGRHFTIEEMGLGLKPLQRPGPPIMVAASVEPAIRRAARIGDAWLITSYPSGQILKGQMGAYREALAAAGKEMPADAPIIRECYLSPNHGAALEECRGPLAYKYASYASWGQDKFLPESERFDQPFEKFVRDRFIIGDPSYCREEILRYRESLGVTHFIMRVQWPGLEQEKVIRTIELLGREVLPSLA